MSIISLLFNGDFGNCVIQYLHARAYAERHGCELQIANTAYKAPEGKIWIGEAIFNLSEKRAEVDLPDRHDPDGPAPLQDGEINIRLNGYRQYQDAMIFSAAQARKWLTFRPEIQELLAGLPPIPNPSNIFHVRHGDYVAHGMPIVDRISYLRAAGDHGFNPLTFEFIEQETAASRVQIPQYPFLADFYRLMRATTLFRSNSSFAWVAALLNPNDIYAPLVHGKPRHREVPCEFVKGNWPALWDGDGIDRNMRTL